MFPFTRASHFGYTFLTHTQLGHSRPIKVTCLKKQLPHFLRFNLAPQKTFRSSSKGNQFKRQTCQDDSLSLPGCFLLLGGPPKWISVFSFGFPSRPPTKKTDISMLRSPKHVGLSLWRRFPDQEPESEKPQATPQRMRQVGKRPPMEAWFWRTGKPKRLHAVWVKTTDILPQMVIVH